MIYNVLEFQHYSILFKSIFKSVFTTHTQIT